MRLFHMSEESDIEVFEPRIPTRKELDQTVGLVWAVDKARLPNFLLPRDCPRVTYHVGSQTTEEDKKRFFSSTTLSHAVMTEGKCLTVIRQTPLYLYEFNAADFVLQDAIAGYYVAKTTQYPVKKIILTDLLGELIAKNVELRFVDNLCELADAVKHSSLNWSLCRMANAASDSHLLG